MSMSPVLIGLFLFFSFFLFSLIFYNEVTHLKQYSKHLWQPATQLVHAWETSVNKAG
jgi:hypothetical protein